LAEAGNQPFYRDPAGQIRGDIIRAMALKPDSPQLLGIAQRVGSLIDEEIDRARRDEARVRYSRGEDT